MEHKKVRGKHQRSFPVAVAGGILLSLLFGLLLLIVLALIAYRTADPTSLTVPMSLSALGVSGFLCGWLCCKLWGFPSVIPALVGGVIFAALIAAAGLCIPGSTLTAWVRCAGCPLVAVLAALGGLAAAKRPKRRRRRT